MLAGYSGTPLPKKLGIKMGSLVRVFDGPDDFLDILRDGTVEFETTADGIDVDVIVLFAEREADLTRLLLTAIPALKKNGGLWIGWPKKGSKVPTDLTEHRLRDIILPQGLVDNKVCAIDEKWSGLRFVWRLENR